MPVLPTGTFDFTIPSGDLSKGLRPASNNPRNVKFLTECNGAVGIDNVLQVLKNMNLDHLIDTAALTVTFPYPQLFVFTNMILVCTETEIYEYTHSSPGTLTLKITVAPGILWSATDFYDYIYMSNCTTAVIRNADSGNWMEVTDLPAARAMCNFNGQVVISPCTEPTLPRYGAGSGEEGVDEEEDEEEEIVLVTGNWYQPSLDVWKGDSTVAVAVRNDATESEVNGFIMAYKGVIEDDLDIIWEDDPQLDYASSSVVTEPPLRMVPESLLHYTFNDTGSYPEPIRMYKNLSGVESNSEIWGAHEWQSPPGWEEFDMHSDGTVVCLSSTDVDGLMLRRSTDFGATFGASYVLDWLLAALGGDLEAYTYQYRWNQGYSIQVDEYTGVFYLLLSWSDIDDWFYHWTLLESSDGGVTWNDVYEWDNSDYSYETDICSLAVSSGNVCVSLTDSSTGAPKVYTSGNGGASFNETIFSDTLWGGSCSACGSSLFFMVPFFDPSAKEWHLYRTQNNGSSWSNILQIIELGEGNFLPGRICKGFTYSGYRNIRASGNIIALTFCGGIYPSDETEWVDPDGVHHSMIGSGEIPSICFWLSLDAGDTWELKRTPFEGWAWWEAP